jgi:hypothetical protein
MGHVAAAESADRKLPRVAGRVRQALSSKRELIRPQNDATAILRQPMILRKMLTALWLTLLVIYFFGLRCLLGRLCSGHPLRATRHLIRKAFFQCRRVGCAVACLGAEKLLASEFRYPFLMKRGTTPTVQSHLSEPGHRKIQGRPTNTKKAIPISRCRSPKMDPAVGVDSRAFLAV